MEWKNIKDNYFVSSNGDIRNGDKILKGTTTYQGYKIYTILGKTECAHRLVALAFIQNPNNYTLVDHIDGNKSNNNYKNLRWYSPSLNQYNKTTHSKTTGKKYIYLLKNRSKNFRVLIKINNNKFDKCFETIEEAILYRNNIIKTQNIDWRSDFDK